GITGACRNFTDAPSAPRLAFALGHFGFGFACALLRRHFGFDGYQLIFVQFHVSLSLRLRCEPFFVLCSLLVLGVPFWLACLACGGWVPWASRLCWAMNSICSSPSRCPRSSSGLCCSIVAPSLMRLCGPCRAPWPFRPASAARLWAGSAQASEPSS